MTSAAERLVQHFGQTVTITRFGTGSYIGGVYQDAIASVFDVVMSVQPMTDRELLNLPEAQRTRRILKGYTATRLKTADEAEGRRADRVRFDDQDFEVQRVEKWLGPTINFFKVILAGDNE